MGILGEHLSNSADLTWQETNLRVRLPEERRGCTRSLASTSTRSLRQLMSLHPPCHQVPHYSGVIWCSLLPEAYEKESSAGRLLGPSPPHSGCAWSTHTVCLSGRERLPDLPFGVCLSSLLESITWFNPHYCSESVTSINPI